MLMNTVSPKILMKYQSEIVFGYELLQLIKNDCSQISFLQLLGRFNKVFDALVSKSPDENTLTLLKQICAHFHLPKKSAHGLTLSMDV